MGLSIVLGLLAATQAPAAPPQQLQKECGLSGALAPSRELGGLWVARAPAAETLACLDSWVSRTKTPLAVVTTEPAGVPWDLPADLEGERPSGMLIEGEMAAVAGARAEAERLGLPVRAWRDTPEPAAILGVGKLEKRVVVREVAGQDTIQIRPMAYVSLTIDHRVVDGHQTNAWLTRFVEVLESWPAE